jgi:hypothetical protein
MLKSSLFKKKVEDLDFYSHEEKDDFHKKKPREKK